MKALLFHCKEYKVEISRIANRPKNIVPEEIKEKKQNCKDCIVALVTVEKEDKIEQFCFQLVDEIEKMVCEVNNRNIVILPFAHLSNNLAEAKDGIKAMKTLEGSLREKNYNVLRSHFGSHKSLLIDIYGHPGNARYREFY